MGDYPMQNVIYTFSSDTDAKDINDMILILLRILSREEDD